MGTATDRGKPPASAGLQAVHLGSCYSRSRRAAKPWHLPNHASLAKPGPRLNPETARNGKRKARFARHGCFWRSLVGTWRGLFEPLFWLHLRLWGISGSCVLCILHITWRFSFLRIGPRRRTKGWHMDRRDTRGSENPGSAARRATRSRPPAGSPCLRHSIRRPSPEAMAATGDDNMLSPWGVVQG